MAELLLDDVAAPPRPQRQVLTDVEFDVLWERLGLGPTPAVLRLPSPGRTVAERREVLRSGWQALRDRGLAGPSGPDPEVARLLRLMSRPARQLELRGTWSRPVRAVAAGGPGSGVLAVRQDATVVLESCGWLPAAVLGVLPVAGPGPGRAATVASNVLTAALGDPGPGLRAALLARDVPGPDAGLLARMLTTGPGRAQIIALVTDPAGVARRAGGVLGVLDGPGGRYLHTRTTGADGVEWSTVAPVDGRGLRHRTAALIEEGLID